MHFRPNSSKYTLLVLLTQTEIIPISSTEAEFQAKLQIAASTQQATSGWLCYTGENIFFTSINPNFRNSMMTKYGCEQEIEQS